MTRIVIACGFSLTLIGAVKTRERRTASCEDFRRLSLRSSAIIRGSNFPVCSGDCSRSQQFFKMVVTGFHPVFHSRSDGAIAGGFRIVAKRDRQYGSLSFVGEFER